MTRRKFALLSGAAAIGAYGGIQAQKLKKPPKLATSARERIIRMQRSIMLAGVQFSYHYYCPVRDFGKRVALTQANVEVRL